MKEEYEKYVEGLMEGETAMSQTEFHITRSLASAYAVSGHLYAKDSVGLVRAWLDKVIEELTYEKDRQEGLNALQRGEKLATMMNANSFVTVSLKTLENITEDRIFSLDHGDRILVNSKLEDALFILREVDRICEAGCSQNLEALATIRKRNAPSRPASKNYGGT